MAKARHASLSTVNSGTVVASNGCPEILAGESASGPECNAIASPDVNALAELVAEQLMWRQEDLVWWKEMELESFWRGYRRHGIHSSALSSLAQEQYDLRISKRNSRTSVAFYRLPLELPSVFPAKCVIFLFVDVVSSNNGCSSYDNSISFPHPTSDPLRTKATQTAEDALARRLHALELHCRSKYGSLWAWFFLETARDKWLRDELKAARHAISHPMADSDDQARRVHEHRRRVACLYQESSLIEQGVARIDRRTDEVCLIDPIPEAFLLDAMATGTAIILGAEYVPPLCFSQSF